MHGINTAAARRPPLAYALQVPRRQQPPLLLVCQAVPQQEVVKGVCYEDVVDQLAQHSLRALQAKGSRYIVGIAGGPGSGKSTLATLVSERINALAGSSALSAKVPMDGFHYYRRQLDDMPDPKEAHARRGAHWTFDGARFVQSVAALRSAASAPVLLPSFDHAVGDPIEDDIAVLPETRIVLCEGNYLFLDEEPWAQLTSLFDDTWFVDVDIDVAMERVFARQVAIGLAPEVSRGRIAGNDRPNAELIARTRRRARVLVPSTIPFRAASKS